MDETEQMVSLHNYLQYKDFQAQNYSSVKHHKKSSLKILTQEENL